MATISKQHEELLAQLAAVRATFTNARTRSTTKMRGKYEQAVEQLIEQNRAMLVLSNVQFPSGSQAALQQGFNKVCAKMNLKNLSVVIVDDEKFLIDFDQPEAEEAFEDHLLRKQGIDPQVLRELTAQLDAGI